MIFLTYPLQYNNAYRYVSTLLLFLMLSHNPPLHTHTHTHTHTHALTEAVVLYDREKEDYDELSGEMGDIITDVEKVSGPHFKTTICGTTCWTHHGFFMYYNK